MATNKQIKGTITAQIIFTLILDDSGDAPVIPSSLDFTTIHLESGIGMWQDVGLTTAADEDGDDLQAWVDTASSLEFAHASLHPFYLADAINNHPVVEFGPAGSNRLILEDITELELGADESLAFFIVFQMKDTSGTEVIMRSSHATHATLWGVYQDSGRWYTHARNSGGTIKGRYHHAIAGVPVIMEGLWDRDADTFETRINGVNCGPIQTGVNASLAGHNITTIGLDTSGALPADVEIAEIVIVTGENYTDENIEIAEAYLSNRFNIGMNKMTVVSSQTEADSSTPDTNGDWMGRPRIAVLDDGVWAMVFRDATNHNADGNNEWHIVFSEDDGETWTDVDTYIDDDPVTGFPFAPPSSSNSGDMEIHVCPNGDVLALVTENATGIYQMRSTDNGETWGSATLEFSGSYYANGQLVNIGTDIYYALWRNNSTPHYSQLWTSDDNGATWSLVSGITTSGTNEPALVHLGGNNLMVLLRDDSQATTYKRLSTDLGATWGDLIEVPELYVLQRPRMKQFDGSDRIWAVGRSDEDPGMWSVVWYTDDDGDNWNGPFYPNPEPLADCGYADIEKKDDGNYYFVTYEGDTNSADLVSYVLSEG